MKGVQHKRILEKKSQIFQNNKKNSVGLHCISNMKRKINNASLLTYPHLPKKSVQASSTTEFQL